MYSSSTVIVLARWYCHLWILKRLCQPLRYFWDGQLSRNAKWAIEIEVASNNIEMLYTSERSKIHSRLRDRCHAHQSHDMYAAPCRRSLSTLNCSILGSDRPRDLSAVACFDAWAFMSRAAISVFVYAISSPQHYLRPCFMLFISWANITEVVTCLCWRGSEYCRLPKGIETWIQASHAWQENKMQEIRAGNT
jgi:hypothetical protein